MTKVEEIFTKHFADHDRRKALAQLRPMQQHGGHSITFMLGTFKFPAHTRTHHPYILIPAGYAHIKIIHSDHSHSQVPLSSRVQYMNAHDMLALSACIFLIQTRISVEFSCQPRLNFAFEEHMTRLNVLELCGFQISSSKPI